MKLTIWWPKQSSVIEKVKPHRARIPFRTFVKTCPKWFALPIFLLHTQLWLNWRLPTKMSQIGLKLTIWWQKQCSVFEKVQPHRARILFWKSVNTCPKCLAPPIFYVLSPTMAQVELAHKKSQIGLKLTIWWLKQCSVIEKVQPHRARILFWKSVNTCPKWLTPPNVFNLSPTLDQVELALKKWTKSNQNWRFVDQNKIRWSKKLSLIEQGYFLENR